MFVLRYVFSICLFAAVLNGIAIAQQPQSSTEWIKQAKALAEAKKYDEARVAFSRAIAASPREAHVYYFRGMFFKDSLQDLESAKGDFLQATTLKPGDDLYWDELSSVLAGLDEFDEFKKLAISRGQSPLFAKSILRLISAERWQDGLEVLEAYQKQRRMPGYQSPYKASIEDLFEHKHRAILCYGLGRTREGHDAANRYRETAITLSHGTHMPGIVVAIIPVDPVAEFERELATFRTMHTELSPSEFVAMVENFGLLDRLEGTQRSKLLARGSQLQPRTPQDDLSLALWQLTLLEYDLSSAEDSAPIIEKYLSRAKSKQLDIGLAERRWQQTKDRIIKQQTQIEGVRKRLPELVTQVRKAEENFLKSGDWKKAIQAWNRLVADSGNDPEVLVNRFFSQSFQGYADSDLRSSEASKLLESLPADHFGRAPIRQWIAEEPVRAAEADSRKQSDPAEQRKIWNLLVSKYPNLPQAHAARLDSASYRQFDSSAYKTDMQNLARACKEYLRDEANEVDDLLPWLLKIEDGFLRDDRVGVVGAMWDELYALLPECLPIRIHRYCSRASEVSLGTIAAITEGETLLKILGADDPRRSDIYQTLSPRLEDSEDLSVKLRIWDQWIDEFPEHMSPRTGRSKVRLAKHDFPGALKDLKAMVEFLGARHRDGRGDSTSVRVRQEAIQTIQVIETALRPCQSAHEYALRGFALAQLGDDQSSATAFGEVVRQEPDHALARCWFASRLIAIGDFPNAAVEIDKAKALGNYSAEVAACEGAFFQAQGKIDEALEIFNRSIEVLPRIHEVYLRKAMIEFYRGDIESCLFDVYRWSEASHKPLPWTCLLPIRLAKTSVDAAASSLQAPHESVLVSGSSKDAMKRALQHAVLGDVQGAYEILVAARNQFSRDSSAAVLWALATPRTEDRQCVIGDAKPLGLLLPGHPIKLIAPDKRDEVSNQAKAIAKQIRETIRRRIVVVPELISNVESDLQEVTVKSDAKGRRILDPKLQDALLKQGTLDHYAKLLSTAASDSDGVLSGGSMSGISIDPAWKMQSQSLQLMRDIQLLIADAQPVGRRNRLYDLAHQFDGKDSLAQELAKTLLGRGEEQLDQKAWEAAMDYFKPAAVLLPRNNWLVELRISECYLNLGDRMAAIVHLENSQRSLCELEREARQIAAQTESQLVPEKIDGRKVIQRTVTLANKPDSIVAIDVLRRLAELYQSEGDLLSLLELRREWGLIEPNNHLAHANLGSVLLFLGKKEDAEASFQQAIKLDTTGKAATFADQTKQAWDQAQTPKDHHAITLKRLFETAGVRAGENDWEGVFDDLRRAEVQAISTEQKQELESKRWWYRYQAGTYYERKADDVARSGDERRALEILKIGETLTDHWPTLRHSRAYLLPTEDRLDEIARGIERAREIIGAVEERIAVPLQKSLAYMIHDRTRWTFGSAANIDQAILEQAENSIKDAIALDPTLIRARLLLGEILLNLGRDADAEAEFAVILEAEPDQRAVIDKLKRRLRPNTPEP